AVAPRPAAPPASGTETILLVEDDEAVRRLARKVLEAKGYVVLEAEDGPRAVELARQSGSPIHLLVTDVVMPHVSGRAVAEQVRALRPGIKVLFLSGYTAEAVVQRGLLDADTPFLEKPFTPAGLASKVREVLDRPGR
ncbi:MAG TPA: response regulator, partial [Vicinamibacterales bacterium]|nr:response regulator [Vicinamibacterales bacterium]